MKKINLFNRNTNLPSYRRRPVSRGFNRGGGLPLFSGMTKKICHKFPSREGWRVAPAGVWFAALVALFVATPSFATPTELDKKTVASKAYVDTKQDIITTGLVDYYSVADEETLQLPSLVSYDSTSGLVGNKIGILDHYNANNDGWGYLTGAEMDNFVPTVRAVATSIQRLPWNNTTHPNAVNAYSTSFSSGTNSWPLSNQTQLVTGYAFANALALKQNKLDAKASNARAQAVTRSTAGNTASAYITAGGSVGLTTRSGAPAIIGYVNGTAVTDSTAMTTFTTGTFGSNSATNQNYIKNALVSLELLKDVYSELNTKITNNALPTGTTGTVVTYNGTNATTGVQEFGETAMTGTVTYTNGVLNNANNIATITAVGTRQKKKECGGYEPAAAGQPAHDGTHPGDENYCWLWIFPED